MKIRSAARPGETGAAENQFIAVDELENKLGSCRVEPFDRSGLMPDRPLELRIRADGEGSAVHQLLGTALTRAMMLAKESGVNARIYAECAPEDHEKLELYSAIGLMDDDALVRMSRTVVPGPSVMRMPEGCLFITDDLSDATERRFFLERQEKLFMREDAAAWLQEIEKKPMMKRMLLTTRDGLAGELLCWSERGDGVIGVVYTAPAWRRKGVALYLMEAARQYFYQMRMRESHIDLRLMQKPVIRLAASAGYRRSGTLMRLPGMNMDAPKKRRPY